MRTDASLALEQCGQWCYLMTNTVLCTMEEIVEIVEENVAYKCPQCFHPLQVMLVKCPSMGPWN